MSSIRTIAVTCMLVMVGATAADAKPKPHTKKQKAKEQDDADQDAEAERQAEADKAEKAEKDKEREREEADAEREAERAKERAKAKAKDVEAEAEAAPAAGGGADAFHAGTLGFSIPITVVGGATGAGAGEPPPTVDIVYFLDDKSALDLIVGLNIHRKHTVDAMGNGADTNLIGLAAGLGYRMYSVQKSLRSFIEPTAVVTVPDISNTSTLGVNVGVALGLERNLTPWFSITGALGATLNFANSFKDIQLATAATLAANLYWH